MDASSPREAEPAASRRLSGRLGGAIAGNAYLLLAFTMLCWGGNAVASRMAVGVLSPMVLVSVRWLVVVAILALVARRQLAADWPRLRRRLPWIFLMGALGFTAFNALFYLAAHSTTAVNLGIVQGAIPVFVLLGALMLHRVPIAGVQVAGILVTLLGVVVVATRGDLETLLRLTFAQGDLIMIVACLLYSGYTLNLRKRPAVSGLGFFCGLALAAFVTTLPLVALEVAAGEDLWPTTWEGLAIILYVALFPSFLAQIGFMRGVALIGAGRAGIFVNLVPVFAAVLAVLILGEPFELFHAAALALVLGGIYLAERGKRAPADL
jgi:drug/metabolite transporter (DMT)-like permease